MLMAQAEGMTVNRDRIVQAAFKLLLEQAYEDITSWRPPRPPVSHQTVLNHFSRRTSQLPPSTCRAIPLPRAARQARDLNQCHQHPGREYGDSATPARAGQSRPNGVAKPLLDAARASHQAARHISRPAARAAPGARHAMRFAPRGNRRIRGNCCRDLRLSRERSNASVLDRQRVSIACPAEDRRARRRGGRGELHNYLYFVDGGGNDAS